MVETEVAPAMWRALADIVEVTTIHPKDCFGFPAKMVADGSSVRVKAVCTSPEKKAEIQLIAQQSLAHVVAIKHLETFFVAGQEYLAVVEEFMPKTLQQELEFRSRNNVLFSAEESWRHISELVWTLAQLQDWKLAHRCIDLNSVLYFSNGLESKKNVLKLANFWWSRRDLENASVSCSLVHSVANDFRSPRIREAISRRERRVFHNPFKSDVYSLGKVLECMLNCSERNSEKLELQWTKQLHALMVAEDEALRPTFVELRNMLWPSSSEQATETQTSMPSPPSSLDQPSPRDPVLESPPVLLPQFALKSLNRSSHSEPILLPPSQPQTGSRDIVPTYNSCKWLKSKCRLF